MRIAFVALFLFGCIEDVSVPAPQDPPPHMQRVSGSRSLVGRYGQIDEYRDAEHHATCWITSGSNFETAISCVADRDIDR